MNNIYEFTVGLADDDLTRASLSINLSSKAASEDVVERWLTMHEKLSQLHEKEIIRSNATDNLRSRAGHILDVLKATEHYFLKDDPDKVIQLLSVRQNKRPYEYRLLLASYGELYRKVEVEKDLLRQAEQYENKMVQLAERYSRSVAKDPERTLIAIEQRATALSLRGDEGDLRKAKELYDQVTDAQPYFGRHYLNRGGLLVKMAEGMKDPKMADAMRDFEKACGGAYWEQVDRDKKRPLFKTFESYYEAMQASNNWSAVKDEYFCLWNDYSEWTKRL